MSPFELDFLQDLFHNNKETMCEGRGGNFQKMPVLTCIKVLKFGCKIKL